MTVIGRYYAMDRDHRWERTKLAWDAIVCGKGTVCAHDPTDAVAPLYDGGTTDEFLPPMVFPPPAAGEPRVSDGDVVFFFNFRSDRAEQLSAAFLDENFQGFERTHWPRVHYVTLTQYDASYDCPHVFPPQTLDSILGQVVAEAGKTPAPHRRNGEIPARHLFLQRRRGNAVPGRGPPHHPVAQGGHL